MATRKKPAAPEQVGQTHHLFRDPPGIEHVPTLPELHLQGLAKIVSSGKSGTYYRTLPEGQRLIDEAMKRNADRRLAWRTSTSTTGT